MLNRTTIAVVAEVAEVVGRKGYKLAVRGERRFTAMGYNPVECRFTAVEGYCKLATRD